MGNVKPILLVKGYTIFRPKPHEDEIGVSDLSDAGILVIGKPILSNSHTSISAGSQ